MGILERLWFMSKQKKQKKVKSKVKQTTVTEKVVIESNAKSEAQVDDLVEANVTDGVMYSSEVDFDPRCQTVDHLGKGVEGFLYAQNIFEDGKQWMCHACYLDFGVPAEEKYGPSNGQKIVFDDDSLANTYKPVSDDWDDLLNSSTGGVLDGKGSWSTGTTTGKTWVGRTCSHNGQPFRFKDSEGEVRTVYLTAHSDRSKKRNAAAVPVDFQVWLADQWLDKVGLLWANVPLDWMPEPEVSPALFIDWPDMKTVPIEEVWPAVQGVGNMIAEGRVVEIGCIGAHGRTGTFVCLLMVAFGWPAQEAIDAIRKHYCSKAVETKAQADMVVEFAERLTEVSHGGK